jgi:hypothetical protein
VIYDDGCPCDFCFRARRPRPTVLSRPIPPDRITVGMRLLSPDLPRPDDHIVVVAIHGTRMFAADQRGHADAYDLDEHEWREW